MQTVSQNLLNVLRSSARDLIAVAEFYHFDAVPGVNGFDPAQSDFLHGVTNVSGISFRGRQFSRRVDKFGAVRRTITKEFNNVTVTLSNLERDIAAFEFQTGFEGLILVIRILSRSASQNLADSIVLFCGRCEKPNNFERGSESVSINAKQLIGSTEISLPRRKFAPDDDEGRHPSDPLFEGFRFSVQYGNAQYSVRERRGGLLGLLGFKKTVTRTLAYSSHSDLDAEKSVPLLFGRAQIAGSHLAYVDVGTAITATTAFCEGPVKAVTARVVTPGFYFDVPPGVVRGYPGGTEDQFPTTNPNHPGNGFYSRTSVMFAVYRGTQAQVDDPAPDTAALILGSIVPLPDANGVYNLVDWTDNPVHQARFLMTDTDYLKLTANFVDDAINIETANYCEGILLDQSGTDTVFLPGGEENLAGTNYQLYKPTSSVTPDYFAVQMAMKQNGGANLSEAEKDAPYKQQANYQFYGGGNSLNSIEPIEPIDPDDPGGGGGSGGGGGTVQISPFVLRRRYTSNVVLTEETKIVDFLFDILFPAARLYLVTTAKGKVGIRTAKPVDNTMVRADSAKNANTIAVFDVEPWRSNLNNLLLIGANLATSEVRRPTAARYTTASNAITLAAINAAASGATLSGGTNANQTATGTVTITGITQRITINVDGFFVSYLPLASDTPETAAAFLSFAMNAHPVLQKYIKSVWTGDNVVRIASKMGFLDVDATLANIHSAGVNSPSAAPTGTIAAGGNLPVGNYKLSYAFQTATGETLPSAQATFAVTAANSKISVAAVALPAGAIAVNWYFSVAGETAMKLRRVRQNTGTGFEITQTPLRTAPVEPNYNSTPEEILRVSYDLSEKNTLKNTFKFPNGGRAQSVNRVVVKYRDATQDFKLTELRIKDPEHIARVKKVLSKEVSGACIDNFHQANRIANGALSEAREGDKFTTSDADGEALLIEEGEVIVVSDASVGLRHLPVRVEDATIDLSSGNPSINLTARRYSSAFYSDDAAEKVLSIPTSLAFPRTGSAAAIGGQTPAGATQTTKTNANVARMTPATRYIPTNDAARVTLGLPEFSAAGDVVYITGHGTAGWRVTQTAGQIIHGASDTTKGAAGYVESQNRYDTLVLVCVAANVEWNIQTSRGTLTIV